jgi:transmembrane sensor
MENTNFENTEIDELLLRCNQGSASREEYIQAWEWVHLSDENLRYYENLRDTWFLAGLNEPQPNEKIDALWQKLENWMDEQEEQPDVEENPAINLKLGSFLRIAAMLVLTFGIGAAASWKYFKPKTKEEPKQLFTVSASKGSKCQLVLADGTRVWLNAGTQMTYSNFFNKTDRNIELNGEAYFQVAKNKELAFEVIANKMKIIALGTEFNVKSYGDENTIEATLIEGKVIVGKAEDSELKDQHFVLQPNQQAIYMKNSDLQKNGVSFYVQDIETNEALGWKFDKMIIRNEKLDEMKHKLERTFDVSIVFESEEVKNYRFSGTFERETIEQVMNIIRLSAPIKYSIKDKIIRVRKDAELNNRFKEHLRQ